MLYFAARTLGRTVASRRRHYLWGTNAQHGLGRGGKLVVAAVCVAYGLYAGFHCWQEERHHHAPPQPTIQQQLQLPQQTYVSTPECEDLQTGQAQPCLP